MKVPFTSNEAAADALLRLGRTEDVKVSPDGGRIAIAGFNSNTILLLDFTLNSAGKTRKPALTGVTEISAQGLAAPHGLSFINDSLLVVANREGDAPILRLPPAGTAQRELKVPTINVIPGDLWLDSPGSVCSYRTESGRYEVLICNNYANYISRHVLDIGREINVCENTLLLARGLDLPDGVSVSRGGRWIAVSNHEEQVVRLYANSASLNRQSEPIGVLRGNVYPHGVLFTHDERFVVVADAGAPYLRIYARKGKEWQGEKDPVLSLRTMSDAMFSQGNHNAREGGLKGIDLVPGTTILAATSENMPLAFFDLEKVLKSLGDEGHGASAGSLSGGQRCPCGSKKAFRNCCGKKSSPGRRSDAQSLDALLREAAEKLQTDRLTGAEELCRQALGIQPGHPKASHMLGFVLYMRSRHHEASRLIRAAGSVSGWRDLNIRYHYSKVLSARLLGCFTAASAKLRCDYDRWVNGHAHNTDYEPLVSILIVCDDSATSTQSALESVFSQSYRHIELVIIDNGLTDSSAEQIRHKLRECPFPHCFDSLPRQSAAQALNKAIHLANGDYINPLDPDDLFEQGRITQLVSQIAQRGFDWGFAACEVVDAHNQTLCSTDNKYAELFRKSVEGIKCEDTVGSSLLGLVNPCGSVGNLFFSRSLQQKLGVFSDLYANFDWDFCLRALWVAEPCFVSSLLYRLNLPRKQAQGKFSNRGQEETEQLLEEYCTRAEMEQPQNRFAPARSTMGFGYLAGALRGNQTRIPPARLVALHDELDRLDQQAQGHTEGVLGDGINLVGFFRGDFGLGEAVRGMATSCLAHRIAVNLQDAGTDVGLRQSNRSFDHLLTDRSSLKATLFYMNPDYLTGVWHRFSTRGELRGRRVIGYWHWEIDQFPDAWLPALDMVDEIWVASGFVKNVIEQVTEKPVFRVPCAIETKLSRPYKRAEFALPDDKFLFLFSFDFASYTTRKNPWAIIDAFRLAFPAEEEGVCLVMKCFLGKQHPEVMGKLQALSGQDSRIVILDCQLSREDMYGLQSLCDAYVSLHRAEGLGLGMAESMALGKPVIGTRYSGNLEFMNDENSCLVDYSLVPVKPRDYVNYESGWMWAEPDVEDAARYMVRLFREPEYRQRIAKRAADDIATHYSPEVVGRLIEERLAILE